MKRVKFEIEFIIEGPIYKIKLRDLKDDEVLNNLAVTDWVRYCEIKKFKMYRVTKKRLKKRSRMDLAAKALALTKELK